MNQKMDSLKHVMNGVDSLGLEFHEPFRANIQPHVSAGDIVAWKAMGAGGGGVVGVLLSEDSLRNKVIEDLQSKHWTHIEWKIDSIGLNREEINL
jgi:mevalonate kinase